MTSNQSQGAQPPSGGRTTSRSSNQRRTGRAGRSARVLSGWALWGASGAAGSLVGGLVATRVLTTTDMGWDQLADALGGMMVGALAGAVVAGAGIAALDRGGRWLASVGALLVAAAALLGLRLLPPNVATARPATVVDVPPFEPALTLILFAESPEVWVDAASPLGEAPWRRFEVRSENWSAFWETYGSPFDGAAGRESGSSCAASLLEVVPAAGDQRMLSDASRGRLDRLAEVLDVLPHDLEQRCAAHGTADGAIDAPSSGPPSPGGLQLRWSVGGQGAGAVVTPACQEAVAPLAELFSELVRLQQELDATCEQAVGLAAFQSPTGAGSRRVVVDRAQRSPATSASGAASGP